MFYKKKSIIVGAYMKGRLGNQMFQYAFAKAKEVVAASADFEKGIFDATICHMPQNSLTQSVTNCEKRAIGTQGGFGYRSIRQGVEVTLLQSCALAYWLCDSSKDKKAQRVSY